MSFGRITYSLGQEAAEQGAHVLDSPSSATPRRIAPILWATLIPLGLAVPALSLRSGPGPDGLSALLLLAVAVQIIVNVQFKKALSEREPALLMRRPVGTLLWSLNHIALAALAWAPEVRSDETLRELGSRTVAMTLGFSVALLVGVLLAFAIPA